MGNSIKCCCIDHKPKIPPQTTQEKDKHKEGSLGQKSKSAIANHVEKEEDVAIGELKKINIYDFNTVTSSTDTGEKEPVQEKKNESDEPKDTHSLVSSTVLDNQSKDLTSMKDNSKDISSIASLTMSSPDCQTVPFPDTQTPEASRRHRVQVNPIGCVVRADCDPKAIKARKSHKRNEAAAKPDKRRRESVHETIHNIGGYIIDKKTKKQVYILPNSEFNSAENQKSTPDLQSFE